MVRTPCLSFFLLHPSLVRYSGTLAPSVTLEDLLEAAKHLDWTHQAHSLGLDRAVATN